MQYNFLTASNLSIFISIKIWDFSVILYINRIIKAIISKKSLFVQWPKGEQRKLVHEGFQSIGGFKNIIGAIDGTHLILNDKPSNTPESYFNRKNFILFNVKE